MAVTQTQVALAGPWNDLRDAPRNARRGWLALDLAELWS
jgi:hypothetical protein